MHGQHGLITDCHVHVVGDLQHFPMMSPRPYTPLPRSAEDLDAFLERNGIARVVIIQLSVYGTDNSCMMDAMARLDHDCRGVIHTWPDITGPELDDYHARGVRGVRVNLYSIGLNDPSAAREKLLQTAKQCARNGWHIQLFTTPETIVEIEGAIAECPVPVVIDHFGLLPVQQRGAEAEAVIRRLLAAGHAHVKVSAPYRLDNQDPAALALDLYSENPDNLVWGSDWPHPPEHNSVLQDRPDSLPYRDIDVEGNLKKCRNWFPTEEAANRVLCVNPARLYDF